MYSAQKRTKAQKFQFAAKVSELLRECHDSLFIVGLDSVGSDQVNQTRKALRGQAEIVVGKNRVIRKILERDFPELNEKIGHLLHHNVALVLCKGSLSKVREIVLANRRPAAAKVGLVAPSAVVVPAGSTGLPPDQTKLFSALGVQTKIMRMCIHLVNDIHLLEAGDKVTPAAAVLLSKLNIRPFEFGFEIKHAYDNGEVFDPSILELDEFEKRRRVAAAIAKVASASLAIGYPTAASVPHSVRNSFKNVLAVACATDITFKEAESIKAYLADPTAFAVAAPAAGGAAEEAAPEPASSSDSMSGGMNMFGDDSDSDSD